jgi:hypothetical protein
MKKHKPEPNRIVRIGGAEEQLKALQKFFPSPGVNVKTGKASGFKAQAPAPAVTE